MQNADAFGLSSTPEGVRFALSTCTSCSDYWNFDSSQKRVHHFALFCAEACGCVGEDHGASNHYIYLEGRYAALEKEIADALRHSPTNDLAVADLRSRKLIIADEIQHNRRLVERFSKLSAH
jgi:hypothetical protein